MNLTSVIKKASRGLVYTAALWLPVSAFGQVPGAQQNTSASAEYNADKTVSLNGVYKVESKAPQKPTHMSCMIDLAPEASLGVGVMILSMNTAPFALAYIGEKYRRCITHVPTPAVEAISINGVKVDLTVNDRIEIDRMLDLRMQALQARIEEEMARGEALSQSVSAEIRGSGEEVAREILQVGKTMIGELRDEIEKLKNLKVIIKNEVIEESVEQIKQSSSRESAR